MIKPEVKEEILHLLRTTKIPIYQIAERMKLNNSTVYRLNKEAGIRKVRIRRSGITAHGVLKTIMEELAGKHKVVEISELTSIGLRHLGHARAGYSIQFNQVERLAKLAGYRLELVKENNHG